jgi:hypothetical protein
MPSHELCSPLTCRLACLNRVAGKKSGFEMGLVMGASSNKLSFRHFRFGAEA